MRVHFSHIPVLQKPWKPTAQVDVLQFATDHFLQSLSPLIHLLHVYRSQTICVSFEW